MEKDLPILGYTKLEQVLTVPAGKSSYTKPVHQPKDNRRVQNPVPCFTDAQDLAHMSLDTHI